MIMEFLSLPGVGFMFGTIIAVGLLVGAGLAMSGITRRDLFLWALSGILYLSLLETFRLRFMTVLATGAEVLTSALIIVSTFFAFCLAVYLSWVIFRKCCYNHHDPVDDIFGDRLTRGEAKRQIDATLRRIREAEEKTTR